MCAIVCLYAFTVFSVLCSYTLCLLQGIVKEEERKKQTSKSAKRGKKKTPKKMERDVNAAKTVEKHETQPVKVDMTIQVRMHHWNALFCPLNLA